MTKRYEREEKLVDRLQAENKQLKGENTRLKKQLKAVNKGYYKFMVAQDSEDEQEAVFEAKEIAKKICWDCKVGSLELIDLGARYFRKCTNCSKATVSKPISNLKK